MTLSSSINFHETGEEEEWRWANYPWQTYPFVLPDFHRAYQPGPQTNCGFVRLVQRLNAGEEVRLAFIGSSITAGSTCQSFSNHWGDASKERELNCAYPARVQRWLKIKFPQWRILVDNKAHDSWTLPMFSSEANPDIADAYIVQDTTSPELFRDYLNKVKGPKLIFSIMRTCHSFPDWCLETCPEPFVVLAKANPSLPRLNRPPHEGGIAGTAATFTHPCFQAFNTNLDSLTDLYSVMTFGLLVLPNVSEPRPDVSHIWNGRVHPDTVGHDFMAHAIEYALLREFFQASRAPACDIPAVSVSNCPNPVSDYDAYHPSQLPRVNHGWELTEDRPTKPGWIAFQFDFQSKLEFVLKNVQTHIVLSYLESYEHVFPTLLTVSGGCELEMELNPVIQEKWSVPNIVELYVENKVGSIVMHCPDKSKDITVTFSARQGKFKVVRVAGC